MEKKQSSIDWLVEEINKQKAWADPSRLEPIIEQAKAMHKNEIIVAFYEGIEQESNEHGTMYLDKTEAEEYYNKKFENYE